MNKLTKSGFAGIASAAILAVVGLMPSANAAFTLSTGGLDIGVNSYSMSTTAAGSALYGIGSEDTWGIFQITDINNPLNPLTPLPFPAGTQYFGIFYGNVDNDAATTIDQLSDKTKWSENFVGTGLKVDIYAVTNGTTFASQVNKILLGAAVRSGAEGQFYGDFTVAATKVYSAALLGNQISSAIIDNGLRVGPNGVFNSTPGPDGLYGTPDDLTQGDDTHSAPKLLSGSATGQLTTTFNNLFSVDPGVLTFSFTGTPPPGTPTSPWALVSSGDIVADVFVPVPEPSTYGLMAAGALLGLVAFRRMKARAQAV
jgi:hypothetical protein